MSQYGLGNLGPRPGIRPSPWFLAFVGVAALGAVIAWTQDGLGARLGDVGVALFVLGGWIITLCCHEFAHAYAAYRAGDRSVEAAGYLTLNPFKYAHPVLSILLPLIFIFNGGIGLPGGAVYLHPHTFRSRGARSAAAAAGPLVNVVFAVVLLLLAKPHRNDVANYVFAGDGSGHARFWAGLAFLGFLQMSAAVLNLLPVPGLDGYAIIEPYLDPNTQQLGDKVKPYGMLVVLLLIAYVDRVNRWFGDGVGWLCRRTGAQDLLWSAGYEFFKFWQKTPL